MKKIIRITKPAARAKNVVLGAGVTGLWTALKIAERGEDVVIVAEKQGGLISNYEFDGYSFDLGGHVYTTGDETLSEILEEAGANRQERKAVYLSNEFGTVPYPVQSYADQLGIDIKSRNKNGKYKPGEDFLGYSSRTLGAEFTEKWMVPFNERVWTVPMSDMDSDWVASRVAAPKAKDEKDWGPNGTFYYARGSEIVNAIKERIKNLGATVELVNGTVTHINRSSKTIEITYGSHRAKIYASRLFSTLPISEFVNSATAKRFVSNRVMTIGVGLNKKLDHDWHWAYMDVNAIGHRVSIISHHDPTNAPEGGETLIMEVPYRSPFRPLVPWLSSFSTGRHQVGHRANAETAAAAFTKCGFEIDPETVEVGFISDFVGYPIPTMGVRKLVQNVKGILERNDIFTIGRWGSHGYFNLDHCMKDAEAAVAFAFDGDMADVYLNASHYYA